MAAIRQAATIADAATAAAMAAIRVGATELEAAAALESVARMMGCEGNILQTQVKGGTRSAYPDALASPRRFQYGDIGYTDLAIFYKGYLGDLSRAFYIGEIADDLRSLLSVVEYHPAKAGPVSVPWPREGAGRVGEAAVVTTVPL